MNAEELNESSIEHDPKERKYFWTVSNYYVYCFETI